MSYPHSYHTEHLPILVHYTVWLSCSLCVEGVLGWAITAEEPLLWIDFLSVSGTAPSDTTQALVFIMQMPARLDLTLAGTVAF